MDLFEYSATLRSEINKILYFLDYQGISDVFIGNDITILQNLVDFGSKSLSPVAENSKRSFNIAI